MDLHNTGLIGVCAVRVGSIDVQATKASVRLFYQGYVNEDPVILVYPQHCPGVLLWASVLEHWSILLP